MTHHRTSCNYKCLIIANCDFFFQHAIITIAKCVTSVQCTCTKPYINTMHAKMQIFLLPNENQSYDNVFPCVCFRANQDEKRMERLKKRLDELELVQNNIRLLGELLAHFKPDSGSEDERSLIRVRSCN